MKTSDRYGEQRSFCLLSVLLLVVAWKKFFMNSPHSSAKMDITLENDGALPRQRLPVAVGFVFMESKVWHSLAIKTYQLGGMLSGLAASQLLSLF